MLPVEPRLMLSLDMYDSPKAGRLLVAVISMSIGGASKEFETI